ncbi:MAG: hypothetical protein K0S70_147 [Microbacterium sp.]|nr:hypothetical protein [Microbacterium sp.]
MKGAENGYRYSGAENDYRVTVLRRKGAATLVRVEACLTGEGTIPAGAEVTIPSRKLAAL